LCGKERQDHFVEYKGEVLGYALEAQGKKLFVSVGHRMSLSTAVLLVEKFIKPGQRSPEPLRVANERSKQALKLSRINKNKGLGMPETRPSR
jgi:deoxyinosine 3'endonuclease (endonuclease V)